ncbi:MAG: hypothetical protein OHK0029_11900 [Armatimonadaceae bacterium]
MPETPFPLFHNQLPLVPEAGKWNELHLYTGSQCNRACSFCCVYGEPGGGYAPWSEPALDQALRLVAKRGSLKFYGGEPTLDTPNLLWAMEYLRRSGFAGVFTIFSNGIRARSLVQILEGDTDTLAVLNYSIATGRGEEPLPDAARIRLQEWAARNPERLFVSHDFVIPVGRQEGGQAFAENGSEPTKCFRCFPVLTSSGLLHACPFAVEEDRPHYHLGNTETDAATAQERFQQFLQWMTEVLEPRAEASGINACTLCVSRTASLDSPYSTSRYSERAGTPLPVL